MAQKIETIARNMRLTDNTRDYVEKKAAKLERYLQEIDEIRVELSHIKSARSAQDRQVAQITVHAKVLSAPRERGRYPCTRSIRRWIKSNVRSIGIEQALSWRGDGRSAAEVADAEEIPVDETGELLPLIGRRKKFVILPMTEDEAVEQMRLLGHDNFFVFFNAEQNSIQVLYRRRNGTYGLIEPVVG
jgi:putative sigma-54 modulation protein